MSFAFHYIDMSDLTDLYEFVDLTTDEKFELLDWCEDNTHKGTYRAFDFRDHKDAVAIRTPSDTESALIMLRFSS